METKTTRLLVTSSTTPTVRGPPSRSGSAAVIETAEALNQIELGQAPSAHTHSHDKAEQLAEDIDEEIHKLQYKVFPSHKCFQYM